MGPGGSHMGHKETAKDTARVLGRMYDAIEFRGFAQERRRGARRVLRRPGLQRPDRRVAPDADARRLPDVHASTRTSRFEEIAFCYLGDARFNMADSYLVAGAKLGHGRPDREPEVALAARGGRRRWRTRPRGRDRREDHAHRRRRGGRQGRRLPAHRRLGLDGRAGRRLEGADRAAPALPGERARRWR